MSFTNTPLGQQRRLDREAFLNGTKKQQLKPVKPTSDNNQPDSQQPEPPRRGASTHTIPVSYSYGAPELSLSRSSSASPPKPSSTGNRPRSPSHSSTTAPHPENASDSQLSSEPANVRYARLKQRNQALGPTTSTSSASSLRGPDLRDTSVNVANAFTQAAFTQLGMQRTKSTSSWVGGNRLAPPSSSSGFRRSTSVLVEDESGNMAADNTEDVDINGDPIVDRGDRAKSPFFGAIGAAGSFVIQAAKRATSRQPEDSVSTTNIQQSLSSVDRTSDYEDVEVAYQRAKAGLAPSSPPGGKATSNKKKPRKSKDNAAYRPSPSESEESEGLDSDEGKRKKKLKQIKGMALPIIGPSKTIRGTKKPRRQSSRPSTSILGTKSRSRSHTPRAASVGGQTTDSNADEVALDEALRTDDSNAYTDPEIQQQSHEIAAAQQAARSHAQSYSSSRSNKRSGVGAMLGTLVRQLVKTVQHLGPKNVLGFLVLFLSIWFGLNAYRGSGSPRPNPIPSKGYEHVPLPTFDLPPSTLEELIERLAVLERAQRSTDTSIGDMGTRFGHIEGRVGSMDSRVGEVDSRVGSVEGRFVNFEGRLGRVDDRIGKVDQRIEQSDIRSEQFESRIEQFGGRVAKLDSTVGQIDARVSQVDSRVSQVDTKVNKMDTRFGDVDIRVDQLGTRVGHVEQSGAKVGKSDGKVGNVDARAKELEARAREIDSRAKEMESHAKRFEGRAQEIDTRAKEIESKSKEIEAKTKELDLKSREHDSRSRDFESKLREIEARFKDAGGSPAWWSRTKPAQQNEQLTIGSEAFEQVVQRAVLATTKDSLARADYALYTGGGRVIPEYTSPTFSVSPEGWRRFLGIGAVQGRPPAVALVPDINVGNCWAFPGSQGQIAVLLSRSVRVDSVTIDHASKDVAYDLKTAPKKFVVWGLVEGDDNLAKLAEYRKHAEAQTIGPEPENTIDLGTSPFKQSIKLTEFEYDINATSHIQTFAVPEAIRAAGIDVGVVIFQILSSHGDPNYTCLYRVRVHGEAAGHNVRKS
ncbi:myosin-4 [Ceratobasidium sp. AG-Ba]|nr:myosin-4 [Ceratobasidium sp. AG-Ba]